MKYVLVVTAWVAVWSMPLTVHAQPLEAEVGVLRAVYDVEAPLLVAVWKGADATAYPAFYAAIPAHWAALALADGPDADFTPAVQMTGAGVGTYVLVKGIKHLVQRVRPYEAVPGMSSRTDRDHDTYAFPSGHAAMAFAFATSASLAYPEWYVVAPTFVWAGAVATSRLWLGVHYPSDVLAGALLGSGVAVAAYYLGDLVTPNALRGEAGATVPLVILRFAF